MQNCYNTGERIPREKKHDMDERLANKHIQTLQFVQEVVNENKVLKKHIEELEAAHVNCEELHAVAESSKEKIKTVQEQYLKRADEINAMMAEKHREEMMKVVQEKLDIEKTLSGHILQLKEEMSQLETTNKELMERIQELSGSEQNVEDLVTEIEKQRQFIDELQQEVELLKTSNEDLNNEKSSQFSQLQDLQSLKTQNQGLVQDLQSLAQRNLELSHKVMQLEAQLRETSNTKDQVDLIDNLKNKLAKLHKERAVANDREEYYHRQVEELKEEIEALKKKVQSAEVTKDRVLEEYYKVHTELQYLKKHQSADDNSKNFKDFVKLKREVAVLREENSELRHNKRLNGGSSSSLPMLKFAVDTPIKPNNKGHRPRKASSIKSS
ncbi:hypothetical protein ACF0H5_006503 [Mactra antiquata]